MELFAPIPCADWRVKLLLFETQNRGDKLGEIARSKPNKNDETTTSYIDRFDAIICGGALCSESPYSSLL